MTFEQRPRAAFGDGILPGTCTSFMLEQTGISYLIVKPGQREAFAHRHRTAEIYVVLSGSGAVKLDDDLVDLAPLDSVRVSPGVARAFQAGPEGLEVLVFGPHVDGDGEMVQDFWGE